MDPSRQEELEAALDEGSGTELPPNQPQGLLGEPGFDLYKVDEFEPSGNAGVSQEVDFPVVLMAVLLAYVIFFPAAYVILWRSRQFSLRGKVVMSLVGALGVAAAAWALLVR